MRLTSALEGLDSIICIADNVLVFGEGTNFEKAQEDRPQQKIHCSNGTLSPKTDRLNTSKLQFKLKEVKFMGRIISDKVMRPDPDKVEAITQMPTPKNKAALL